MFWSCSPGIFNAPSNERGTGCDLNFLNAIFANQAVVVAFSTQLARQLISLNLYMLAGGCNGTSA